MIRDWPRPEIDRCFATAGRVMSNPSPNVWPFFPCNRSRNCRRLASAKARKTPSSFISAICNYSVTYREESPEDRSRELRTRASAIKLPPLCWILLIGHGCHGEEEAGSPPNCNQQGSSRCRFAADAAVAAF